MKLISSRFALFNIIVSIIEIFLAKVQNFSQKIAFFFGNSQMLCCPRISANVVAAWRSGGVLQRQGRELKTQNTCKVSHESHSACRQTARWLKCIFIFVAVALIVFIATLSSFVKLHKYFTMLSHYRYKLYRD